MSQPKVEVVLKNACGSVGEGPHWDDASQSLLFVDIKNLDVHRYNTTTGEDQVRHLSESVSLSVCLPCRLVCLSVGLPYRFVCLSIGRSVFQSTPVCLSFSLTSVPVCRSVGLPVFHTGLSVDHSVCIPYGFVGPSSSLPVYLLVDRSVFRTGLFVGRSVRLPYRFAFRRSVCFPARLSVPIGDSVFLPSSMSVCLTVLL